MIYPSFAALEVTTRCSGRCIHCAQRWWGRDSARRDIDMAMSVYRACIATEGLKIVKLGQYGEPLSLLPGDRLVSMIRIAKRRGLQVWTTTNGQLLYRNVAYDLFAAGLDQLVISVDGIDKHTFETLRPGLRWETVKYHVEGAVQARMRMGRPSPRIIVNCVLTKEQHQSADETRSYWMSLGVDGVAVVDEADVSPVQGACAHGPIICERPYKHLTVHADGNAVLCCRDAHGLWPMGSVHETSPLTIFNGALFERVRQGMASGRGCPAMCAGCRLHLPDPRAPRRAK